MLVASEDIFRGNNTGNPNNKVHHAAGISSSNNFTIPDVIVPVISSPKISSILAMSLAKKSLTTDETTSPLLNSLGTVIP
jgi:hypothetical protein